MKDLGLELKIIRIKERKLQREIAAAAGLSASRLSEIENSWKIPRADELERIRRALGLPDHVEIDS
jgi:transcriptional regulator with XRE-family HTH domain